MVVKGNRITKKQQALVALVVCVVAGLIATVILLIPDKSEQQTPATQPKPSANQSADPSVAPPATERKLACDLLDDALAAKIIGQGAAKNDKLTAISAKEYSASSCEYAKNDKKVSIMLYKYPDNEKAQSGKAKAESEQLVFEDGGRKASTQPKSSVGIVKDVYVVTATVTLSGKYDASASQKLAQELVGKL